MTIVQTLKPIALVVISLTCLVFIPHNPKLIYNSTASMPKGFYWIHNTHPQKGDHVLIKLPPPIADFAAKRNILPRSIPLLKTLVAVDGDQVCRFGLMVLVNGDEVAKARRTDTQGRPLPVWQGCSVLGKNDLFVLSKHAHSFDSRYFGPVSRDTVMGVAVLVWRR